MLQSKLPVIGFAAYSGTGKTTLLKQLIPLLSADGIRVGAIKHAHHDVEVDIPGKDSYELRKAGAGQVLLASSQRWALIAEEGEEKEPDLQTLIERLDSSCLDLILVEGFRHLDFPKIELHRSSQCKPLLFTNDASIIAVATDAELSELCELPLLDMNSPPDIREFILNYMADFQAEK